MDPAEIPYRRLKMRQQPTIEVLVVLCLALVLGIAYYCTLRPGQDWGGDFSQYISHARNLAFGRPYLETKYVVTFPESGRRMPAAYPPVLPLMLAPAYRRFGLNYIALKIPVEAMFVLSMLVYYALARLRGLGTLPAAFAVGAFGLSGLVLSIKDLINSESTYVFFAGLTLIGLLLAERKRWDETRPVTAGISIAILMLLAYGTRAMGLSLVIGFSLYEFLVRKQVRKFTVVVLCVFTLGVVLYSVTVNVGRSYAGEFQLVPRVYLSNVVSLLKSPGSLWCDPTPSYVRWLFLASTVVITLATFLRQISVRPSVVECYVVASVLPLIGHSTGYSDRYLVPVYALYFVYFMEGVIWLRARYAPAYRYLVAFACALLAVGAAVNLHAMERGPYRQGVEQATFLETCQYIRASVDANDLVVSWNPRVLALYTDRTSAWYPYTEKDDEFNGYLSSVHAGYVLLYRQGEKDERWLAPHLTRQPERFELAFSNADFCLYRVTTYRGSDSAAAKR